MPGSSQGSSFRFTVPHHASGDQIRIVKHRSESMGETITYLASFVNRAGCFWGTMAADASGERKLSEELFHPFCVFALIWVDFRIASVEIYRREEPGRAMSGTRHIHHVQIVFPDHAIQMCPDKGLPPTRSPMAQ